MISSKRAKAGAVIALAAGFSLLAAANADAREDRVRWKMHGAFASNTAILGPAEKRLEKAVHDVSNGTFELKLYEPGALVPGIQYYDPVAAGAIDAAWGTQGYNVNKNAAFALFGAVPFGPRAGEYLAWMKYGGGYELWDELHARYGVKGLVCGVIPPEASGWFRKEIKSVEDLKGLKMRFYGYGARVMEKFGVSTQLLAGGDIYPALELGTIDATEFSLPAIDESIGFYQVAKHYYFPGWHQQSTLNELLMNRAKYDALSDYHKRVLEVVCGYQMMEQFTEGEAKQFKAMADMQQKGVTLHRWPSEILAKFEAAWNEVVKEEAAKDPDFKRVYDSYAAFREKYAIWRDMGYLN